MGKSIIARADLDKERYISQIGILLGYAPRAVFFLGNTVTGASDNNPGTDPGAPLSTLAVAMAKCADNSAHVVYVLAGHSETLATAGNTWSKSGVAVLGEGCGRSSPLFTAPAADVKALTISGNNNLFRNLRFTGSASQSTATSYVVYVTGTDNTLDGLDCAHGALPLRFIGAAGATRTKFKNITLNGTAAGPDVGIFIETACLGAEFVNILGKYIGSSGLDSALIKGSTGVAFSDVLMDNVLGFGMDATLVDVNGSHASISTNEGLVRNSFGGFSAGVTIANGIDAGTLALAGCWLADATSAAIATGAVGAITTASQRVPAGSPCT